MSYNCNMLMKLPNQVIHTMKFYYFTSLTKIVEAFLVLDEQCIGYLTFIKFLSNITQAYNSNY